MNDEQRAQETLRKLAELKAQKTVAPVVEKKAKVALKDLGVPPEDAAKAAMAVKVLQDLSQGNMAYDIGNFSIGAKMTPEEKALRFGYKKGF